MPVFQLDKTSLEEERSVNLRVLDVFGKENKNVNVEVIYKIVNDETSDDETTEDKFNLSPSSTSRTIDVTNNVSSAGNYYFDIKYNSQNVQNNLNVTGTSRIKFTVLNKVKITHVKISLGNPVEKADEKEM